MFASGGTTPPPRPGMAAFPIFKIELWKRNQYEKSICLPLGVQLHINKWYFEIRLQGFYPSGAPDMLKLHNYCWKEECWAGFFLKFELHFCNFLSMFACRELINWNEVKIAGTTDKFQSESFLQKMKKLFFRLFWKSYTIWIDVYIYRIFLTKSIISAKSFSCKYAT